MVKRSGAFLHLCSFSINGIIEVDVYVRADISTIDDQWRLHMKKWFCALGMMLALLMSVALADGVKVTFAEKNGQINGGYDYTLKLNVSPASDKELTVSLTCDGLDGAYSVVIPAGQKSTTLTVPTQVVEERGKVVFELQSGDGYTGAGKHTLTIQRLPNVQFYLGINFGTVGKKMSVRMTVTNSSTIVKGNNTFQLRDDKGTVLAEAKWSNPSGDMSFSITPTADMEGYTRLSVWLGDRCVADGGYLTVVAKGQRAVKNVETERKLVGIGMDCGFGGKNTDQVLEVLAKHNTNITFFMTGYFVRTFPEESKRVLAAGNEIGDHTNTHPQLTKERPYSMMRQIVFPAETMAETLGVSPRLMRPPYGDVNSNVISVSRGRHGVRAVEHEHEGLHRQIYGGGVHQERYDARQARARQYFALPSRRESQLGNS